jgi:hypothetical protein
LENKVKKLILLFLAITCSTAYAYVITSEKKTTAFGGSTNMTYYIKCDSGVSTTVVSNSVSWTKTVYQIPGSGVQYPNVDTAAKAACKE